MKTVGLFPPLDVVLSLKLCSFHQSFPGSSVVLLILDSPVEDFGTHFGKEGEGR